MLHAVSRASWFSAVKWSHFLLNVEGLRTNGRQQAQHPGEATYTWLASLLGFLRTRACGCGPVKGRVTLPGSSSWPCQSGLLQRPGVPGSVAAPSCLGGAGVCRHSLLVPCVPICAHHGPSTGPTWAQHRPHQSQVLGDAEPGCTAGWRQLWPASGEQVPILSLASHQQKMTFSGLT